MNLNTLITGVKSEMPVGAYCFLFVFAFILLAQAGLYIFNLLTARQKKEDGNEVAGIMFGGISLIYSLVLAFVIVAVWEDYDDLNKNIQSETDKINGIITHSSMLPDSLQQPIDTALTDYCMQVINKEWRMEDSDELDHPSAIPTLRTMLLNMEPQSKVQENIFTVIDENLSAITELRRSRINHNRSQIPELVWLVLQAGSVMVVVFSFFFYVRSANLKRIYLFFLSGCIAMCMFLVYALDHPFSGVARVSNKPYQTILTELKTINH